MPVATLTSRQVNFGHGEHPNPKYLTVNPVGKIPSLKRLDGLVAIESAAIPLYLAELAPDRRLFPVAGNPTQPEALRWLSFMANDLYATMVIKYHYDDFEADGVSVPAPPRAEARQDLANQLTILEKHTLADKAWMNGARKAALDVYAAIIMSWRPSTIDLGCDYPPLARQEAAVWDYPLVDASFRKHQLADPTSAAA